jgi:hypothetical protein
VRFLIVRKGDGGKRRDVRGCERLGLEDVELRRRREIQLLHLKGSWRLVA